MIKVTFEATNPGSYGGPQSLLEKEFKTSAEVQIPSEGDRVTIQYDEQDSSLSAMFEVEKIDWVYWKNGNEDITIWLKCFENQ